MEERIDKETRRRRLAELVDENPFMTDQDLARHFGVSVQTIRLDRTALQMPDVRSRIKAVAKAAHAKVRSLSGAEVIGELVDLVLDHHAISILHTTVDMGFRRSGIIRGHHIFAMANSLAVAVVDAKVALTGSASLRFKKPVYAGDRLLAKAAVSSIAGRKYGVEVTIRNSEGVDVFSGDFTVIALESDAGDEEVRR